MRHHSALLRAPAPRLLAAACALVLPLLLLAWLALRPGVDAAQRPAAGAAQDGFVAARALAHVRALARAPRPVASAANEQARAYLLEQLRALGLGPEVELETAQTASVDLMGNVHVTLATAHNILVRKPGSGPRGRPAVLASAHYDSNGDSLGAADGAMSAASLLEALRVLQAGPPLDNDLLFVFTDADDAHALGTRGFAESHPWARRARVALRFDNLGNSGPLELVDASHADGFTIDAWVAAPAARGSSFMAELTRDRPQRAAAALLAGSGSVSPALLQFATLRGMLGPNGLADVPQRLAPASLQHEGDTMVALLRRLGNTPLPALGSAPARGQVFFTLPGLGGLHYTQAWVWPLDALACMLSALACWRAVRQRVDGTDIVQAAFGFVFMTALATFVAYVCRDSIPGLEARYDASVLAADAGADWQLVAFLLLPAAAFVILQRHLQARLGARTTMLGALLTVNIALLATSAGAPGASYVLALPLLAAQAAWLALSSQRAAQWSARRRGAVLLAAALPAVFLIVPAAHASLAWVSPQWLVLPSSLVCAALALAGMALAQLGRRFVARTLLLGCAGCLATTWAAQPRTPQLLDLPQPNHLVYFKDTPSWQSYWLYPALPLDAWTRRVFPHTMHPYQLPYLFGVTSMPVWFAAAPRIDAIAYPDLMIEKDERPGPVRHVEIRLRSKNRAPSLMLRLDGVQPLRASVNGRVLTDRLYRGWKLDLSGMGDQELRFAFDLQGDAGFNVFIQERIPGLPQDVLPPRPSGMLPALMPGTGTTVSSDILRFP
ncbi:M28 family peptidase [Massilia sp. 9096]|uniref:M28 family peptidase n=1 Tax=Massilia sp. 9096 TaxID=1500894 RepID=UPI000565D784|nr:M28 family peptidase [Massilia sp. 9096]